MKTKKQLPKEFTFICDENSKEQLEKLGVDLDECLIDMLGFYYTVKNNQVEGCTVMTPFNSYLIKLSDYIDQEQPIITITDNGCFRVSNNPSTLLEIKTDGNRIPIEQKWQPLTRGGYEYHIYEEFKGNIFGRIKRNEKWIGLHWNSDGRYYETSNDVWDLLPINHELTTLEKELEEVRLKEKDILKKIDELKTK